MAGYNHTLTACELKDLRAWRALVIEAWGQIRPLESFAFAVGLPVFDVLPTLGLGGSEWACERWTALRRGLDEPVVVSACFEPEVELDAAA